MDGCDMSRRVTDERLDGDTMTGRGNGEDIPFGALVRICGVFAAAIGVVDLVGWSRGVLTLSSLGSGNIPMPPSTAVLLVLYGTATVVRARSALGRGAYRFCAAVSSAGVAVASLLLVCSYLGIYPQAEHLGFSAEGTVGGAPIGHMSPATALGLAGAGLSLLASLPSESR